MTEKKKKQEDLKRIDDPDLRGAEAAMHRAARAARRIAKATGTPLILWEDGKVVEEWMD